MIPTLSVLLCLGLCLNQRMLAQAVGLPRPFLWAVNGSLVPERRSVSLRCRGSQGADLYQLVKRGRISTIPIKEVESNENEVEFSFQSMRVNDAGIYFCTYKHSTSWSEHSDPLQLVVTGRSHPPSLSVLPGSEVTSGHNVTLQCQSKKKFNRYALHKNGEVINLHMVTINKRGSQATFHIPAVTPAHGGTYRCYAFQNHMPHEWSAPSDPLVLRVTETASSPKSGTMLFGLPILLASFLIGFSSFLILLFLFFFILCHRHKQHQFKLKNGSIDVEAQKITKSSDPTGTPLEEALYANVGEVRQTEEVGLKDTATQPQEVTYVQLNFNSLKAGAKDPFPSGAEEPSFYAALP